MGNCHAFSFFLFPSSYTYIGRLELNKRDSVYVGFSGCGSVLGLMLLLIGALWLYKLIKRRKVIKLKQMFFKRNGGLLLQQQLSASESNVERTKFFASKELEKATDNYHERRILGQGGQGTVYKGV